MRAIWTKILPATLLLCPCAVIAAGPEKADEKDDTLPLRGNVGFFDYDEYGLLPLSAIRNLRGAEKVPLEEDPVRLQLTKDYMETGGTMAPAMFQYFSDDNDAGKSTLAVHGALRLQIGKVEARDDKSFLRLIGGYELHKEKNIGTNTDSRIAFAVVHGGLGDGPLMQLARKLGYKEDWGNEFLIGPSYQWDRSSGAEGYKLVADWQPWKTTEAEDAKGQPAKEKPLMRLMVLNKHASSEEGYAGFIDNWFDLMVTPRLGVEVAGLEEEGSKTDAVRQALIDRNFDGLGARASVKITMQIMDRWKLVSDFESTAPFDDLGERSTYGEHRLSYEFNKPSKEEEAKLSKQTKAATARPMLDLGLTYRKGKRSPDYIDTDQIEIGLGARF